MYDLQGLPEFVVSMAEHLSRLKDTHLSFFGPMNIVKVPFDGFAVGFPHPLVSNENFEMGSASDREPHGSLSIE